MRELRKIYVSPATYARLQRRFVLGSGFVGRNGQRSVFRWLAGEHFHHNPTHNELFLFYVAVPLPDFGGVTARELLAQRIGIKGAEDAPLLEIAA